MCLYLYYIEPNLLGTIMGRFLSGLNSIHDVCRGHLACCAQCPHCRLQAAGWAMDAKSGTGLSKGGVKRLFLICIRSLLYFKDVSENAIKTCIDSAHGISK